MDTQAIQQGLANAAGTVSGLQTYPQIPDSIAFTPAFAPLDYAMDYHVTFGTMAILEFTVGVFVSRGDHDSGLITLNSYLARSGATSIVAALEADKTLGGVCSTLIVDRVHDVGKLWNIGGTEYFGAEFDVRVWAT